MNWDNMAKVFQKNFSSPFSEEAIRLISQMIEEENPSQISLLEVGAGTGAFALPMARILKEKKNGEVLATDFSPQMVKVLKENAEQCQLDNVTCKIMDGVALDVTDNSFNYLVCILTAMFFSDKKKGFREMHRVLHANGKAIVCVIKYSELVELLEAIAGKSNTIASQTAYCLSDSVLLTKELMEAGFPSVDIRNFSTEVVVPELDFYQMILSNPMTRQVFDEKSEEDISKRISDFLHERYPNKAQLKISVDVLYAIASK